MIVVSPLRPRICSRATCWPISLIRRSGRTPSGVWKERVQALVELGKDEDADGIKSWLRSQYADSIRERKRGAVPQDFDLIGNRISPVGAGPRGTPGSRRERRIRPLHRARLRLLWPLVRNGCGSAAETRTPGLECVHFNAQHNFTLQYPVLLAPLRVDDDEATATAEDSGRRLRISTS